MYPKGLIELPHEARSATSPRFAAGKWKLRRGSCARSSLSCEWAIEHRAVFDFLGHPSCLYVTDPKFQAIELICSMVKKSGNRTRLVDLDSIARRVEEVEAVKSP